LSKSNKHLIDYFSSSEDDKENSSDAFYEGGIDIFTLEEQEKIHEIALYKRDTKTKERLAKWSAWVVSIWLFFRINNNDVKPSHILPQ